MDPARVYSRILIAQTQARLGDNAHATPFGVAGLHELVYKRNSGRRSFGTDHARIGIHEERLTLTGFAHCHRECRDQLFCRESRQHAAHALLCEILAELCADDGVDVAGIQEDISRVAQRRVCVGHGFVCGEQREVGQPFGNGLLCSQACGWDSGLETHRKKRHLFALVLARVSHGIKRRVDHLHAGASRTRGGQAPARSRHAHEVAKGRNGHPVFGQPDCLVDKSDWCHAHRTPRPTDELHLGRQQLANAETEYLVSMGAADFHDAQRRPIVGRKNLRGRLPFLFAHAYNASSSSSVSCSSSSVIFAMAMPAWTMT